MVRSEKEETVAKLFSIKPALSIKGRKFKGIRGFAGKPFHPPLTDIPVAAYILAAAFDSTSKGTSTTPTRSPRPTGFRGPVNSAPVSGAQTAKRTLITSPSWTT
jgi:hypothetical protein